MFDVGKMFDVRCGMYDVVVRYNLKEIKCTMI
jgi:hypothetical protein